MGGGSAISCRHEGLLCKMKSAFKDPSAVPYAWKSLFCPCKPGFTDKALAGQKCGRHPGRALPVSKVHYPRRFGGMQQRWHRRV